MPKSLPPIRYHDHAIHLQEIILPPNIRRNKYPYAQKSEIEQLVQEMLRGVCKKLRDLLDAMVEWSQSLLIHKIEIIPSNSDPAKPSPKASNKHAN